MSETTDPNEPHGDATDLVLRLVEETARRRRAEALAETATATADAETARATLVDLRATAVESIAAVRARDRAGRMAALHDGLLALRADLQGLRAAAEAALTAVEVPRRSDVPSTPVAPDPPAARSAVAGVEPELVENARELLARGRLDVADEVIRGLEDAAARLRAQTEPTDDG